MGVLIWDQGIEFHIIVFTVRPPEWSSGLRHCIAVLAVPLEILFRVQALSQPAATGRPMGRRIIGPASSGMLLSHRTLATTVAGQVQCTLTRSPVVCSSNTLVRLASRLSGHCVKEQCGLAGLCFGGRTALDLRLSRVRTGVAAMRQDCNYQLEIMKLGTKKVI
jgi:hypothetical protein